MSRIRLWSAAVVAAAFAGSVAAQPKVMNLSIEEGDRWVAMRDGKGSVKDANAAEAQKNLEVVKKKALVEHNLFLEAAKTDFGSSETKPVAVAVRRFYSETVIDPNNFGRKLNQAQLQLVNAFGKEMADHLGKVIGTKEKPSGADLMVKINAARMMSFLAKSGYEDMADVLIEMLNNDTLHDAVKVYALQGMGNLFATPNSERPGDSVFTKVDREAKAMSAVIAFLTRKPTIDDKSPKEEVDGFRYVRREAIKALGQVRRPIMRIDDKVVAEPALWLLRFANADTRIAVPPSLSERLEAGVAYLQLNADKDQNADYAMWYVSGLVHEMTVQYRDYKQLTPLDKPKPEDTKPPERKPDERDALAWKYSATRLSLGLKDWMKNWEDKVPPSSRPAEVQNVVRTFMSAVQTNILEPMSKGNPGGLFTEPLEKWRENTRFPAVSLYSEVPASTVTRADGK